MNIHAASAHPDRLRQLITTEILPVKIQIHKTAFRTVFQANIRAEIVNQFIAEHCLVKGISQQRPFPGAAHPQNVRVFRQDDVEGLFQRIGSGIAADLYPGIFIKQDQLSLLIRNAYSHLRIVSAQQHGTHSAAPACINRNNRNGMFRLYRFFLRFSMCR